MATYRVQIFADRNYSSQEVMIEGVNSSTAAMNVARSRYPGANIKAPRIVDPWIMRNAS